MFSDHDETYDRRRHPRIDFGVKGSMFFGPNLPRRACTIVNISEGGARLHIGLLLDPPERFGLSLHSGDILRRECKLIWQSEFEIGTKFV
jgi:hypothetical protein